MARKSMVLCDPSKSSMYAVPSSPTARLCPGIKYAPSAEMSKVDFAEVL